MERITSLCTGCRNCEQICPTHSIIMKADDEGFIVPIIDQTTCIDCSLCQKRCPQNMVMDTSKSFSVYAFRYNNDKDLFTSASGGAFISFARYVVNQGGVVYGAAYVDDDLHVGHVKVNNVRNLYILQSSKYVQSNTYNTYNEVKQDLLGGRLVLYSGTPCQIAGLKAFLKSEYENLLTIDVICHGVPSPLLFEKYIQWMSSKNSKIVKYDFRDKGAGWGLVYKAITKYNSKSLPGVLDPYYYHFLKGNTYRECCYKCKYSKPERISDITIGDYWGIEKEHPDFYSTKGVSCVLVNTDKGNKVFDNIRKKAFIIDSSFDKVARHNGNLLHPTERNVIRDHIYNGINEMPLNQFFSKNMNYPKPLKTMIKAHIPGRLKLFFKRYMSLFFSLLLCSSCKSMSEFYSPLFKCTNRLVEPYGVCTHINREGGRWEFDSRDKELENIKLTGVSFLRTDFDWSSDHRRNNNKKFDLAFPLFDQMMRSVQGFGLQTLGILSMCRTDSQLVDWKNYVSQTVSRYQEVKYWEVVNEVDIVSRYLSGRKTPFHVSDYALLLKDGYNQIKMSNKKAKVLFSGLSSIYNGAIDTLFNLNISPYFDIMNLHWYTSPSGTPEELLSYLQTFSGKMKKCNVEKPLWMTEVGYSTALGMTNEESQDIQLPRTFLICFVCGVDKVFWYKGRSSENNPNEKEDCFGLWHKDYVPKPAYYAYKTLTKMCPNKSSRPQLQRRGDVYLAFWKRPDGKKAWAVWTSKEKVRVKLNVKGKYDAYNNHGNEMKISPSCLEVSPSVIYVIGANEITIEEL